MAGAPGRTSAAAAMARARTIAGVLAVAAAALAPVATAQGDPCSGGAEVSAMETIAFPMGGVCSVDTYPDNQECQWDLSCEDPDTVPQLLFNYILTEAGSDFVTAYDGATSDLLFEYSGHMPGAHSVTFENDVILEFESDSSRGDRGFEATFRCAPPEDPCRRCDNEGREGVLGYEVRCGRVDSSSCDYELAQCTNPTQTRDINCCSANLELRYTHEWRHPTINCPVYTYWFRSITGCPEQFDYTGAGEFCAEKGGRLCTAAELENRCAINTGCARSDKLLWSSTPCSYDHPPAVGDPCADGTTVEVTDQQSIAFHPTAMSSPGVGQQCQWTLRCPDPTASAQLVFLRFSLSPVGEVVRAYNGGDAEPSSSFGRFVGDLPDGHRVTFSGSEGLLQFTSTGSGAAISSGYDSGGFVAILDCVADDHPCRECAIELAALHQGQPEDDTTVEREYCPEGMYSIGTGCIGCEAGKYNPKAGGDGAESCMACLVGQHSEANATVCTFCSSGRADEDSDPSTPCAECVPGTYAGCGEVACSECAAGQIDSDEDAATPCVECLAGHEWVPGSQASVAACVQCAVGRADLDEDSTTECSACSVGEYAAEGSSVCASCSDVGQFDADADPATPCSDVDVCEQYCGPGTQDRDCNTTTPCEDCEAGRFAPGGVFPQSRCEPCAPGTIDDDESAASECTTCQPGYYAEAGQSGECISCTPGRFDRNASKTPCNNCPDGKYSGASAIECKTENEYFRCPDKARQISASARLEETCRDDDGSVLPQSTLPDECTNCTCKKGFYDASEFEINCWSFDKKFDGGRPAPQDDLLNHESVQDIDAHKRFEGENKPNWTSTCVLCPSCVDCSSGSDWQQVTIKEGYGLATQGVRRLSSGEKVLDVFTCPLTGSCLNLSIADVLGDGKYRSCSPGYTSSVPLCAYCVDDYIKENNGCTLCKAVRTGSAPILILMAAALVIGVVSSLRLRFTPHHFQVTAALLRLMWPRLTQSAKLIITNYQILSGLPERIRIPFPSGITKLLKMMTTMINVDILTLPGLGCLVGSSFYAKFLANMLTPLFLAIVAHSLSKRHLRRLQTSTMPMPKDLEVDLDSIGPVNHPERRKIVHRRINFKICRAVVGSKLQAPYYQFICFIVYLRYPAVAKLVFYMFRCRAVDADTQLLEADYQQTCFEDTHLAFAGIGLFFLFAYVIGIPAYILYVLTRFKITIVGQEQSPDYKPAKGRKGEEGYKPQVGKEAISGNREYIGIAHFKPLFQFYKPTSATYRFEMYFWIEKVLLVGFTEMFGNIIGDSTGITQWLLNMAVVLAFLTLIASYKPFEAHGTFYNAAYVLMHIIMIYFYIVSLLLNPRVNLQESAIDNLDSIDTSLVISQCGLFIFMVIVSFKKIEHLWHEARAQVHAERVAEAKVKEHTVYFEQLRRYFSDRTAIALTNAHHYGGFGAILGDMALKDEAKLDQAMGNMWQRDANTVDNPLQERRNDSSTSSDSDNETT